MRICSTSIVNNYEGGGTSVYGWRRQNPEAALEVIIIVISYHIARNFYEHKFSRITNKHKKKNFAISIFAIRSRCLTIPLTIYRMEMVSLSLVPMPGGRGLGTKLGDPQRVFQHRNNRRYHTYQRVSVTVSERPPWETAKGRELTQGSVLQL